MQGNLSKAYVLSENNANNQQNFEHLQINTIKMVFKTKYQTINMSCRNKKHIDTDYYRFYKTFQNTFFVAESTYKHLLSVILMCKVACVDYKETREQAGRHNRKG